MLRTVEMLLNFKRPRVLLVLLLCGPVAAVAEDGWVESITLGFGYSKANSSLSQFNGGVNAVEEPDSRGRGFSGTLVFNYELLPGLSPYVDLANLIQDDRDFLIPSVGLRYQFESGKGTFQPYLAAGVSYVFAEWNESPIADASVSEPSGQSFGLNAMGGVDIYMTEHLAFNVTVRFDSYDIETSVIENSRVTTIEDKSSISALIGLTYHFGKESL